MVDTPSARACAAATFADPGIRRAFQIVRDHETDIESDQISLTQVAAPPFEEEERSRYFSEMLRSAGFSPVADPIHNVIVPYLEPGPNPVIVGAHLDTVFPRELNLELRRTGCVLHLPGISDNGAGLVALLWLFRAARDAGLRFRRPVLGVANVGEEGQGDLRGIRRLFASRPWGNGDCEFIAVDGGGIQRVTHQALGSWRFQIRMYGQGGHSWADFGQPNPIHGMAAAIHNFVTIEHDPDTSFNVGIIHGGMSVNAIPKQAVMQVDLRSTSSRQLERLKTHLERSVIDSAISEGLELQVESLGERPLGQTPPQSDLVQAAIEATRMMGVEPELDIGSTDANIPMSLGVPAIAIGGGGRAGNVHTPEEWFDPTDRTRGLQRLLSLVAMRAGLV